MAISPVDMNMMQRLTDVAQIKHNENARPEIMHTFIGQQLDKDVQDRAETVIKKDDADKNDTNHDAKEKGKNEYQHNGEKRQSKKPAEKIEVKKPVSFDVKI